MATSRAEAARPRPARGRARWLLSARRCRRGADRLKPGSPTRAGQFVPIPASVPHEEGDMVDRRIVPDLRWIAQRYPIYITDGFSGHAARRRARRLLPAATSSTPTTSTASRSTSSRSTATASCDATWRGDHPARPLGRAAPELPAAAVPLGRLRRRRRPRLRQPPPPLLDARAGAAVQLAEWVEVFPVSFQGVAQRPLPQPPQPRAAGRDLDRPLRRPLAARRLSRRRAARPRMRPMRRPCPRSPSA